MDGTRRDGLCDRCRRPQVGEELSERRRVHNHLVVCPLPGLEDRFAHRDDLAHPRGDIDKHLEHLRSLTDWGGPGQPQLEPQVLVEGLGAIDGNRVDAGMDLVRLILEGIDTEVGGETERFDHADGQHPFAAAGRPEGECRGDCRFPDAALAGYKDEPAIVH